MKEIGQLTEEQLVYWRKLHRWKWLYESVTDLEKYTQEERLETYDLWVGATAACVVEFDIDESRPWDISQFTGKVFYLDEGSS